MFFILPVNVLVGFKSIGEHPTNNIDAGVNIFVSTSTPVSVLYLRDIPDSISWKDVSTFDTVLSAP